MKAINSERDWGLVIDGNGKIVPQHETMPLLLKLLNDLRLFSELSHKIYDVPSTQTVDRS
jgi:hypothetical protein